MQERSTLSFNEVSEFVLTPFGPFGAAWPVVVGPRAGSHDPRTRIPARPQEAVKPSVGDGAGRYRAAIESSSFLIYEGVSLNGRVAHYFVCQLPGEQPRRLNSLKCGVLSGVAVL